MIRILFLFRLLFVIAFCNGQAKIVYRAEDRTLILDIISGQRIVLDTTLYYNEKLVGVKVLTDSVRCHYSKEGIIFVRTYDISFIKDLPVKSKSAFIYKPKYSSYYLHNFYLREFRLVVFNNNISLLKDNELLWDASKKNKFNKFLDEGKKPIRSSVKQHPIIAPDEESVLITTYRYGFTSWSKLYEVEMRTGQKKLISKDGHYYEPSYSADGQYILYAGFSSGDFKIYNKKSKANEFDYGFRDAFWLYQIK